MHVPVTETKGIRDYFRPDEILYFIPNNVEDLARVIRWVYEHPVQTRTFVERGGQVYRQHRWKGEQQHLLDVVANVIGTAPVLGQSSLSRV
ncbi:MAG: glycosyltransferase [Verrucomicrobiota bacterium]